jgi:uncharacterized protein (DUF1501 family)
VGSQNAYRCIECEELALARVSDARPVQTMPIPASALAGLPSGRSALDLTRRRLLQAGIAGFASVYGPRALGWQSIWESVVAEAAGPATNCVVLLYLAGGNDGLNTIVPTGSSDYATYQAKRPVLHRQQGATAGGRVGCQPLSGPAGSELSFANPLVSTSAGGDNGSSVGLDTLYGAGDGTGTSNLAIMPSVDYTPPNLSHFESSDYWFSGALAQLSTGWLGRWLDIHGSATNPLQAISLDSSISKAIRTSTAPICSIPSLSGLGFSFSEPGGGYGSPGVNGNYVDANGQLQTLAGVAASTGNTHLARSRTTFSETVGVYNSAHFLTPPGGGGLYPANSRLASQLKLAGLLLGAGLGTRIVTIHWGSLDTHGNQLGGQDPQLTEMSVCLGAFQADLVARRQRLGPDVLGVRPASRRERLGGHRPRRRGPDDGDGQEGPRRLGGAVRRALDARQHRRPDGPDRLSLGLLGGGLGVAGDRPVGGAARHAVGRLRAAGPTGRERFERSFRPLEVMRTWRCCS